MSSITNQPDNNLYTDSSIEAFLMNSQPSASTEAKQGHEVSTEVNFSEGEKTTQYSSFSADQKSKFELLKDDKFLNKRFISHLFGDSFMQDSIYEGWFVSDALLHMITILQDNEITPEISKVLADLKGCFEWHAKMISYSNSSSVEDMDETEELDDTEEAVCSPSKLILEMSEHIKNLEVGQKFLVPGGCRGHAVLYEVKRQDADHFMFAVYNTGEGAIKHVVLTEDEGINKVLGVYRLHNVKCEKILDTTFLEDLLKLKEGTAQDFGNDLYDTILSTLEGDKDEIPTDPREYMLIQRSGTCVWKMLSAYCRYNLPLIQRKYIKLKARLDVFQKWYDLGHPLDSLRISQSLLGRLVVNYKHEIFGDDLAPTNFSREELLTMGIYKAKKTFNKYKMLLNAEEISKAETWHKKFTGQSIHEV